MRLSILLSILLLISTVIAQATAAADDTNSPNVKSLMTQEDYLASGLEKLTDEERAHLSEWVERYREGAVIGPEVHKKPSEQTPEERSVAKEKKEKETIVAKVIPYFRGWTGKTVFPLDNGQVWRQRMPSKFLYDGSDSSVSITRNIIGKYKMEHVASGRGVLVERID